MLKSISTETLTVERLREVLDYDPETGIFTWRFRQRASRGWNTRYAHKEAGCVARYPNGDYRIIRVDAISYGAARLAWLHVYGVWPSDQIDHKDGDGLNNRLVNLRDVTNPLNSLNHALSRRSTSGVSGVNWQINSGKWQARAYVAGRYYWLGLFTDLADAEAAVIAKRAELGFSPTHGLTRERRAELGPEAVAA